MRAFEVEEIEKVGADLRNVVVGKILAIEKHPNADKLQVVKVIIEPSLLTSLPKGERKSMKNLQIVCGAWNIQVGDKVPVALVGAKLPNGLCIKEAEIRGVKSFGMLCAEDELGLGKDHGGILILDANEKIGAAVSEVIQMKDALMEIKVLPDRAHDALSHIGMAREICALEGRKINYKFPKAVAKKSKKLKIEIRNKKLCARYLGAVIEGVQIENSPVWAKVLLKKFGSNPINNIVDVTNYVLLETGQPMHAFDLDKLAAKNGKIVIEVRNAKVGEEIKLLDGNTYKLTGEDIVIADSEKAIALAGVMGGADTAITNETKNIVLESANFDATSIRKTRVRLNIITDASIRFEKAIDPNLAEVGILRALEILRNFPGNLEGLIDMYAAKVNPWKISLDLEYVNKLLGENVSKKAIIKILNSLELKTTNLASSAGRQKSKTIVEVLTFRLDLKTQEDLIEEIGRIYGYEKIRARSPHTPLQPAKANEERIFTRKVKEILAGLGFSEVYNYSFYARRDAELAELRAVKHLELQNPMNPEQELMRVSLIPNLLKNVSENLKREKELRMFEVGKVYHPSRETLPQEKNILVGLIVLNIPWKIDTTRESAKNFYETKGCVDALLNKVEIYDHFYDGFEASADTIAALWHAGRRAEIKITGKNEALGYIGEVNPLVLKNFGIEKRVVMFEFNLEKLRQVSDGEREYLPIRKFPEVERDISLLANDNVRVDDILRVIQKAGGDLVLNVDLFDIFDFADNTTSYSFRVIFGADRTLKSEEVDVLIEKIVLDLENKLKIKIRK